MEEEVIPVLERAWAIGFPNYLLFELPVQPDLPTLRTLRHWNVAAERYIQKYNIEVEKGLLEILKREKKI